jgi:predicted nucleotide-binding protein
MATRRTAPKAEPKPVLELLVPREEAEQRLQDRIEKGRELRQRQVNSREAFEEFVNDYRKWSSFNSELLKRMFTNDELQKEYEGWAGLVVGLRTPSLAEEIADRYKKIDDKIHRLDSIIERLELIPLSGITQNTAQISTESSPPQNRTNKVFVVHGRDETAKTSLEVFLHENGFDPIVLHRQADEGMTIIEKFEKHSDVGYAFILLTPDEIAYLAQEESLPDDKRNKEFRARPNVIFEFGYFVGKLSRNRVCCLYTGDVTLPSDVHGMIYKRYERSIEEVAYPILKDLKAAGYKPT